MPAVGVTLTPPGTTPYLVVKQDNNGATFVVTTTEAPWIAVDAAACAHVVPREIGAWTHPTFDDIPTDHPDANRPTQTSMLDTSTPF